MTVVSASTRWMASLTFCIAIKLPLRTATSSLNARSFREAEGNQKVGLQSGVADLQRRQQPNFFSKGTVRDHLKEYVEDLDKRIALIAPHCEIHKVDESGEEN
jgi:hypothetical protein